MKDCFGLHSHYAFGSVAKEKSGGGRKSATSVGLTTDLVHWLQEGRLSADAGHRAAAVILRILRGNSEDSLGCHQSERRWLLDGLTPIGVHLPYIKTTERSLSIYSIGAIEDLETFDYSRLRRNFGPTYATGSASPSLSGTHYGREHLCGAEGEKAVCQPSEAA